MHQTRHHNRSIQRLPIQRTASFSTLQQTDSNSFLLHFLYATVGRTTYCNRSLVSAPPLNVLISPQNIAHHRKSFPSYFLAPYCFALYLLRRLIGSVVSQPSFFQFISGQEQKHCGLHVSNVKSVTIIHKTVDLGTKPPTTEYLFAILKPKILNFSDNVFKFFLTLLRRQLFDSSWLSVGVSPCQKMYTFTANYNICKGKYYNNYQTCVYN